MEEDELPGRQIGQDLDCPLTRLPSAGERLLEEGELFGRRGPREDKGIDRLEHRRAEPARLVGHHAEAPVLEADRRLADPGRMERIVRLVEDDPVRPSEALAEAASQIQGRLDELHLLRVGQGREVQDDAGCRVLLEAGEGLFHRRAIRTSSQLTPGIRPRTW